MSAFRGIATGFLQAKIRNTEANDALKARVLETASNTLLTETIPNAVEAEKFRENNYNNLVAEFKNPNVAELADINDFTKTEEGMEKFRDFIKENKLDDKKLATVNFDTDYNTRYDKRGMAFNQKFDPLFKQIGFDEMGGLGPYTLRNQLLDPEEKQIPEVKDVSPAPPEPASTKLADYFTPMQSTVDLGTPNQVDQSIQGFRGFDQGIIRDATGAFVGMELFGEKANERNAFKAVMTRIAPNYVVGDTNKADLTSTAQVANKVLFDQTQGYIGEQVLDGYKSATFKEKIRDKNFDINRYNASGFTKSFNENYPTDDAKIEALVGYMFDELQTRSERVHFAQSFASNILDSNNDSYRNLLLIALDPTLIPNQ